MKVINYSIIFKLSIQTPLYSEIKIIFNIIKTIICKNRFCTNWIPRIKFYVTDTKWIKRMIIQLRIRYDTKDVLCIWFILICTRF